MDILNVPMEQSGSPLEQSIPIQAERSTVLTFEMLSNVNLNCSQWENNNPFARLINHHHTESLLHNFSRNRTVMDLACALSPYTVPLIGFSISKSLLLHNRGTFITYSITLLLTKHFALLTLKEKKVIIFDETCLRDSYTYLNFLESLDVTFYMCFIEQRIYNRQYNRSQW